MFKTKINQLLNNQKFEKIIFILIILNLIVFILDSIKSFHYTFASGIKYFEIVSIIIFTIEYLLRVINCKSFKDIFKPMMLIDFFAVAPYYLSFCPINTVFLRIFRLSRLIRILKIGRYSQALENILNAFKQKKEELIITFSIFFISILISSILMYLVENPSQPHVFSSIPKCFYFSIITFTSVGYGDISPVTDLGKLLASIIAILGVGLHGLFIGVIGVALMNAFTKQKS